MGPVTREPAVEAKGIAYDHARRGRRRDREAGPGRIGPIDFAVSAGMVVGLVGPNGAGKSTLLRLLATLIEPDAGELRLLGEPVSTGSRTRVRRRIGWVPDAAPHFGRLTGRENTVLFGRAAGLPAADAAAAAERLLARLGLAADADRPAREYSFGMSRKLALAEALVHAPPLAVLDEPTIGLDPASRDAAITLVRERAAAGAAVIIATNDVAAADAACDHVALLHHGRVIAAGRPDELVAATGDADRIDIVWQGEVVGVPRLPAAIEVVISAPNHLRVRAAAGAAALPELCRALLEQGCAIRSIVVRRPDLRDAFEALTGAGWEPETGAV